MGYNEPGGKNSAIGGIASAPHRYIGLDDNYKQPGCLSYLVLKNFLREIPMELPESED
jgi:hypothetical protein